MVQLVTIMYDEGEGPMLCEPSHKVRRSSLLLYCVALGGLVVFKINFLG